jgi:enamine deaminase RidA (YjgF/YER057c/UK114 family)
VTKLDRLARSTLDLLRIIDLIGKEGAGFKSLCDPWADNTSPHGRLGDRAFLRRRSLDDQSAQDVARGRPMAFPVRFAAWRRGRRCSISARERRNRCSLCTIVIVRHLEQHVPGTHPCSQLETKGIPMKKPVNFAVVALAAAVTGVLVANAQGPASGFSKRNYNFSPWTKGRFSEMVTVTKPARFITVAGIGAESEADGHTMYPGDMLGQCRYAFVKIKRALATEGATLTDVTRMITFVTDMGGGTRESAKPYQDYVTCRKEAFGSGPVPASTIVQITRLAAPDMLIEINVDAMLAK